MVLCVCVCVYVQMVEEGKVASRTESERGGGRTCCELEADLDLE